MSKYYTRYGVEILDENGVKYTCGYNLNDYTELYYRIIGLDLQDIDSYLIDTEISNNKIKEEFSNGDEYAHNFLLSSDYERFLRVDVRYPFLLRNTVFITLYSLFEDKLFSFHKAAHIRLKVEETYAKPKEDIMINGLIRLIEGQIDIKLTAGETNLLNDYRHIRNCIIHQRGRVNRNKHKVAALNLKDRGVSLIENERGIYLEKSACSSFSKCIENLFLKLCKGLIAKEKLLSGK